MKKMMLASLALVAAILTGCTSIDSSSRFNSLPVNDTKYPAVAHVNVRMSGFYLFHCIPIISGSASSGGKIAVFKDTVSLENATALLTETARGKGGDRIHDVVSSHSSFMIPLLFSMYSVEVSGTASSNTPPERRY